MKRLASLFLLAGVLAWAAPGWAAAMEPTNAWDVKPFPLPDLKGEKHTVADWKGKVIMLNFWATWCLPCQEEVPDFNRWQAAHGDKGLQVIGIGLDDPRKVRNFARSLEMAYPVLTATTAGNVMLAEWGDPDGEVPYTVIIAPDGSIPYIQRGIFTEAAFKRFVEPLLKP